MSMRPWGILVVGITVAVAASRPLAGGAVTPRTQAPSEARVLSRAFAQAARAIGPSVVRIEVESAEEEATASGIVIDTRGNVVTSSHVIDGARKVEVVLLDGRRLVAHVVGKDPQSDVAVVRLTNPPGDLSAARFGDSDLTEIGEWVLAVGSPLGLEQTITAGIISGHAHVPASSGAAAPGVRAYIQTDAKINPGNSGGPLVNLDGEVIGLSALISAGPGGSYGFAVPINLVRRVAQMLIKDGHARHAYIGVSLRDVRDLDPAERDRWGRALPQHGALVSKIFKGAPAARAGLRPGDVITTLNNRDVPAASDVVEFVSYQDVGTRVVVGFVRSGREQTVPLSLDEVPSPDRQDVAAPTVSMSPGR
jgi:putative serine protease PepD